MRIIPRRRSLPCTVVLCVPEEREGGSTAVEYEKRDGLDEGHNNKAVQSSVVASSVRSRERPGLTAFSRGRINKDLLLYRPLKQRRYKGIHTQTQGRKSNVTTHSVHLIINEAVRDGLGLSSRRHVCRVCHTQPGLYHW